MKQIPLDFKLSKAGPDTHIKKSLKTEVLQRIVGLSNNIASSINFNLK